MFLFRNSRVIQGATSVLCVVLTLNLCLMSHGCGWGSNVLPTNDGIVIIPLSPGHPVTESLRDTAFESAQAIVIDVPKGSFRLSFPDNDRALSGQFVRVGATWEMTDLYFESNGQAGTMTLDPTTRQVTSIQSAEGAAWHPSKPATPAARLNGEDRLDSYLASNQELVALAARDGKGSDAEFGFIPIAFFTIMIIWMLCADPILIVCPGILPIFLFIVALLGVIPPDGTAAVNNLPDARDDAFTLVAGAPLNSEVLTDHGSGPDSDPDGDPLSTSLITGPTNGSVLLGTDGSFTYTPNAGFVGTDTFVYQLSDGRGGTDNALVTITMTNQPPDARDDDFAFIAETGLHMGNLFADNGFGVDSDPDGHTFTIIAVDGSAANVGVPYSPFLDVLVINADGTFTYDDDGVMPSPQTFTYTISDGFGGTDTATVSITVVNP